MAARLSEAERTELEARRETLELGLRMLTATLRIRTTRCGCKGSSAPGRASAAAWVAGGSGCGSGRAEPGTGGGVGLQQIWDTVCFGVACCATVSVVVFRCGLLSLQFSATRNPSWELGPALAGLFRASCVGPKREPFASGITARCGSRFVSGPPRAKCACYAKIHGTKHPSQAPNSCNFVAG